MRTAFIQELIRQARLNPKLFLVVGDLGFTVVEPFAKEFPDRFLNAGVAEQNMTGVAAGLASEGFQVFTYSIGNFPTLRCVEQIRNDICYHQLPVTATAVGGGLAYGNMGYSHHAVQDLAVMRTLPNLTVLSPADPGETNECVQFLSSHTGPAYLRLGKAGEKSLHDVRGIRRGPLAVRTAESSVALVATGSVLAVALRAAETLKREHDLEVAVYSCPLLKPTDTNFFKPLWRHRQLITLEEHIAAGGFGDSLRALKPETVFLNVLALPETESSLVGSQEYLRQRYGLTVQAVANIALSAGNAAERA
ncbi:MAG: transketolase [Verrucomicrobia bacterium]|nr:transketolase [Verrucomicrobiota bacterium]